jgi:hypothetical protein
MKKQAQADNVPRSDNGGRRSGADRRKFSYTYCIPERRNGQDRRNRSDRRRSLRSRTDSKKPSLGRSEQRDQTEHPS